MAPEDQPIKTRQGTDDLVLVLYDEAVHGVRSSAGDV
jgi:hypothetical protein